MVAIVVTVADADAPDVTVELVRLRSAGIRYRVEISATDDEDPDPSVTAELCVDDLPPIAVANGEVVRIFTNQGSTRVQEQNGRLVIHAAQVTLVATAVDAAGNEATAETGMDNPGNGPPNGD